MQQALASNWFKRTFYSTAIALLLVLIPIAPVAIIGGLALLTILPGMQFVRWLGQYQGQSRFKVIVLSTTLGMLISPIIIYWSSLLFGFHRWLLLVILPLYVLVLAGWVSRHDTKPDINSDKSLPQNETSNFSASTWTILSVLIGFVGVGVFLAYFELETPAGYYPVQMEDWQKHYGVAFALRHTGIPPTSMFFHGMFPNDKLVYYYFLHLNGATLDLLQGGEPSLHNTFVIFIILAAFSFCTNFFLLALRLFHSRRAALWSLAFATVIGGLDIIPILQRTIQNYRENFPQGPLPIDLFMPREHIDNWVSALSLRLNTFFAHYIWVPQHLTALAILCLGCYLYLSLRSRRKLLLIYPLLLFSLLGHSTWIAVIVSGCLFLFALSQIATGYRQQGLRQAQTIFGGYAVIAIAFGLIAAPFIFSLIGPDAPKSGIAFEIPKLDSWSLLRLFQARFGPDQIWARILDLPLHFFIELGALLIAGIAGLFLYWRKANRAPIFSLHPASPSLHPFFLLLLITGFVTVSFFASGRAWANIGLILNNDLGLRGLMPGQVVLALFAGYFMAQLPNLMLPYGSKALVIGSMALLIGLGLANPIWEFTAMGLAKYWAKPQLASEVYQTLRALPQVTPPLDKPIPVVQHRLHRNAARFQLSLGGRPVGYSTGEAVVFHRDVNALALALELSQQAFDNGLPVWSYQMFQNLGANYLFVGPAEREAMRHPEKYRHPQYFERVYSQGEFDIYRLQPLPFSIGRPAASFDQRKIEYLGYFVDAAPRYPGEVSSISAAGETAAYGFVTAWRLTGPADKNYTLFVHLVDAAGNIVAQADHQLWAWSVNTEGPTSSWTPKLINLDITPVPEAALTSQAKLTIRLGLWLPDTEDHFPVETDTLEIDPEGRLVVGQLKR